jgi:LPS export ABC transporter protein LptC
MRFFVMLAFFPLIACQDHGVPPRRTVAADSADQILSGMSTTISRDGVRESIVTADSTWIYEQRQVSDLKTMIVTMFDSTGAVISRITADKGIYRIRDQSLDARGHVVATSPSGRVLKTEHLVYDTRRNIVSSDTAFTSTSPKLNMSGAYFTADPGFNHVVVTKPKNLQQKGRGVIIGGAKP